jgi:alkanesulfonate monooxygenase SsuD/methylene tetrahydromethanopterin reductase-like flavin-dependent oxidoreductase (luciferase family)
VLTKQAICIDHISGGRLVMGIGAQLAGERHAAYGLALGTIKERLDRFEEACQIITGLLNEDRTTFDVHYYRITDAPLVPKAATGKLPVLIGGGGEKRTMRIAAQYADEWNVWGDPALLAAKREVLARHCEAIGRDPDSITRSANALLFLSEDESWVAERRSRDAGRPSIVGTPSGVVDMAVYADAGVEGSSSGQPRP